MKFYKAVVIEKTAPNYGETIATTKPYSKFKNMSLKEFKKATQCISCFTIEIFEI